MTKWTRRNRQYNDHLKDSIVELREFSRSIVELAQRNLWTVYHEANQLDAVMLGQVSPSSLILVRGKFMLFRTLKTGMKPAPRMQWHRQLEKSGVDIAVWRPADWPEIEDTLGNRNGNALRVR